MKGGYILEHRLVMSNHLGRPLRPSEVVHHKNHNITDNRIENLELFASPGQHTKSEHSEIFEAMKTRFKGKEPPNKAHVPHTCSSCGKRFMANINRGRKFCSTDCFGNGRKGKRYGKSGEFTKGFTPWNKGLLGWKKLNKPKNKEDWQDHGEDEPEGRDAQCISSQTRRG